MEAAEPGLGELTKGVPQNLKRALMPTYAFGVDYDLKSDANLCFSKLGVFRVDYDLKSDSNFYFGNEVLWFF